MAGMTLVICVYACVYICVKIHKHTHTKKVCFSIVENTGVFLFVRNMQLALLSPVMEISKLNRSENSQQVKERGNLGE